MSNQPVIEKGISIPSRTKVGGRISMFRGMEIGDSVFLPGVSINAVSGRTSHVRKNLGFKFTARTTEGGVRVWRIE